MRLSNRLIKKRYHKSASRMCSGAAAIEFAMVGPLFVFLMSVAFDLSLILFTQSILNQAAVTASRIIMTNQTGGSATSFSTALCNNVSGLIPCGDLQYYVQSANAFSSMSASVVTGGSGNLKNAGTFSAGSPGQDVVIQVAYNRPTLIPWALEYINGTGAVSSKSSNLLVTTVTLQNEP